MKSCISAGEQDNIPISIGEGKWYTLKIEKINKMYRRKPIQAFHFSHIVDGEISPLMDHKCPSISTRDIFTTILLNLFNSSIKTPLMMKLIAMMTVIMTVILKTYIQPKPLRKGLKYFASGHVQKCKTVLRVDIIFLNLKYGLRIVQRFMM